MRHPLWVAALATVLATALSATAFAAEPFPSKPLRIVVPVAAGGWGDLSTRVIAQKLSEELGQPVIVENRTGAGGLLGIRYVKTTPADGYTLVSTGGTMPIQAALSVDPGFDPLKDFVGVGYLVRSPSVVVVGADSPDRSLADIMKRAKAGPNKISYASAGVGTATHIAAASFLKQAGIEMLHVPYKGNGAAMPDLIAGRIGLMFDAYGSSSSNLAGGRLRALAVTSTERLKVLPEVPTVAEQGVPGFSSYFWLGLFAPAGTPNDVVQKLSTALNRVLVNQQLKDRLQQDGTQPLAMSPDAFKEFFRKEVTQINTLVKDLAIPKQ
jgi:tripartite-type tricarboxylate transporter receptor subunit TctC